MIILTVKVCYCQPYKGNVCVTPWFNVAYVSMIDVNKLLEYESKFYKTLSPDYTLLTFDKFSEGAMIGINIDYPVDEKLSVGGSAGYLSCKSGKIVAGKQDYSLYVSRIIEASLIPVMATAVYSTYIGSSTIFGVRFSAGSAFSNGTFIVESKDPKFIHMNLYEPSSGSGFILEFSLNFSYDAGKGTFIEFNLTRRTSITKMENLKFDYSGISYGIGMNMKY